MLSDVLISFIIFQGVFFLLDLYIYTKTDGDIARKGEYDFFCLLILVHMVYLVLNSTWTSQEYGLIRLPQWGMTLLCMGSLLSVTSCAYIFFRFTIEKILVSAMTKKAVRILYIVPEVVIVVLILSSPWTGWAFSLNENNMLIHGPAYTFMLILASLYLVAVVAISGYNAATAKTRTQRRTSMSILLAVAIIVLFVILDDLLMKSSILPVAVFAAIVVIFISMQESNIYSDVLTGMNNRRKAYEYITGQLVSVSDEKPMYLFVCDLNGFKGINDLYGHIEGDEALLLCSKVLKNTVSKYNGFAARLGGDEFLLSLALSGEKGKDPTFLGEEINRGLAEQARQKGKPYGLSMSVGYARCTDREEPLNECIRRADEMLYRNKREYHRTKTQ